MASIKSLGIPALLTGIFAFSILSGVVLAQDGPLWEDNTTNVTSGSIYTPGRVYNFGINWTNETGGAGVISNVTFETNLTTGTTTLMNITKANVTMYTTFTNDTTGVWNISFTQEQFVSAGVYAFKWYANDTANVWNSSDQWIYNITQGTTNVSLYLNGTEGNRSYIKNQVGNITVSVNTSYTVPVNLSTNFTSGYNASGDSPLNNITILSYAVGLYNITGYFEGNSNFTADTQLYWLTIATTTTTTTTTTLPSGYPLGPPSPVASTTPGKAIVFIPAIAANSKATVVIEKTEGVDFTEISITVKNKVNFVYLTIRKLDAKPSEITEVPGKVYHYINIVKEEIEDTDISNAKIKFKVENSWISGNNIDKTTVALNRYANNTWNKLSTTKLSEDATYVYYEAETPGFSYFAISGETIGAATTTTTPATTTTTLPTTTTTVPGVGVDLYKYWPILVFLVIIIVLYLARGFLGKYPEPTLFKKVF